VDGVEAALPLLECPAEFQTLAQTRKVMSVSAPWWMVAEPSAWSTM